METCSRGLLRLNSTGGDNPCKGPEATMGLWAEASGQRGLGVRGQDTGRSSNSPRLVRRKGAETCPGRWPWALAFP